MAKVSSRSTSYGRARNDEDQGGEDEKLRCSQAGPPVVGHGHADLPGRGRCIVHPICGGVGVLVGRVAFDGVAVPHIWDGRVERPGGRTPRDSVHQLVGGIQQQHFVTCVAQTHAAIAPA